VNGRSRPIAALLSAALAAALLLLSGQAAPDSVVGADRLALAALYGSTSLALFACAGAFLLRRPLPDTLGLVRPRTTARRLAAYIAGTIGTSQLLDLALRGLEVRESSVLGTIDRALVGLDGPGLVAVLGCLALAPGFAEELLFRGLLQRTLARPLGRVGAIVATAVAFGALHIDPAQGTAAALIGLYLGAVAMASGSTWPAIACHVANNFAGALLAATGFGDGFAGPAIATASVALAAIGIWAATRDLEAATRAQAG